MSARSIVLPNTSLRPRHSASARHAAQHRTTQNNTAYTLKFVTCTFATLDSEENTSADRATSAPTTKATDVKKPKTFWTRTREECMFLFLFLLLVDGMGGWMWLVGYRGMSLSQQLWTPSSIRLWVAALRCASPIQARVTGDEDTGHRASHENRHHDRIYMYIQYISIIITEDQTAHTYIIQS